MWHWPVLDRSYAHITLLTAPGAAGEPGLVKPPTDSLFLSESLPGESLSGGGTCVPRAAAAMHRMNSK